MPRSIISRAVFGTASGSDLPQSALESMNMLFEPYLPRDFHHSLAAHLGFGIEGEGRPEAALQHLLYGLFIVVIDDHRPRIEPHLDRDVHAADGAALLVAVRGMDLHEHPEIPCELQLRAVILVLGLGLVVVTDLTHRDYPFLAEEKRQNIDHLLGQSLVVGLLAVESDRAVVANAELRGAEALPAHEARKVVDERSHVRTRLAQPECRFDDGDDACRGHSLVVIRGSRAHVDVGSMNRIWELSLSS